MISLGFRTLLVQGDPPLPAGPRARPWRRPLVTTTLYFVVFGVSIGHQLREVGGVPYARFIVPGLVLMGVVQNAYLNSASSLFVMKLQGTIVDVLVSPLSYAEILGAFVAGGGGARAAGGRRSPGRWPGLFTGFEVAHPLLALAVVTLAAVAFAAGGVASAIWAPDLRAGELLPHLLHPAAHLPGRRLLLGADAAAGAGGGGPRQPGLLHGRRRCASRCWATPTPRRGSGPAWCWRWLAALAGAYLLLRSGWRLRG